MTEVSRGVYELQVPEDQPELFNGLRLLRFRTVEDAQDQDRLEVLRPGSRMFSWMVEQLKGRQGVCDATPRHQPGSVHDISPRLFDAYTVDGGGIHLAGCTLEDRPVLRLTYWLKAANDLAHAYVRPDGTQVPAEQEVSLGLHALNDYPAPNGKLADEDVQIWCKAAEDLADRTISGEKELIAIAIVWCKYAGGKLAFRIGSNVVESLFEGWAIELQSQHQKPAPYHCGLTGLTSYDLAATADGRISVAEAIETCSQSEERVLTTDLTTCAVTGRRALTRYFVCCPVSGDMLLSSESVPCGNCGQTVSPNSLKRKSCRACHELKQTSKDDPRMARVLGEYPKLDAWGRWRTSEGYQTYILTAGTLARQLLLILDKDSLRVERMATCPRFFGRWVELSENERHEFLS